MSTTAPQPSRRLEQDILTLLASRDRGLTAPAISVALRADDLQVAMALDAMHRIVRRDPATERWTVREVPLPADVPDLRALRRRWLLKLVAVALLGAAAGLARSGPAGAAQWAALHALLFSGLMWTAVTGPQGDPVRLVVGFLLRLPAVVVATLAVMVLLGWLANAGG